MSVINYHHDSSAVQVYEIEQPQLSLKRHLTENYKVFVALKRHITGNYKVFVPPKETHYWKL